MDELIESMINKNNVFVIGYGLSGSGKTTTLISNKVSKIPETGCIISAIAKYLIKKYGVKTSYKTEEFYNSFIQYIEDGNESDSTKFNNIFNATITIQIDIIECKLSYDSKNNNVDVISEPKKMVSIQFYKDLKKSFNDLSNYLEKEITDKNYREISGTSNNPESSRSHVIACLKIPTEDSSDNINLLVGDFAGVENTFKFDYNYEKLNSDIISYIKKIGSILEYNYETPKFKELVNDLIQSSNQDDLNLVDFINNILQFFDEKYLNESSDNEQMKNFQKNLTAIYKFSTIKTKEKIKDEYGNMKETEFFCYNNDVTKKFYEINSAEDTNYNKKIDAYCNYFENNSNVKIEYFNKVKLLKENNKWDEDLMNDLLHDQKPINSYTIKYSLINTNNYESNYKMNYIKFQFIRKDQKYTNNLQIKNYEFNNKKIKEIFDNINFKYYLQYYDSQDELNVKLKFKISPKNFDIDYDFKQSQDEEIKCKIPDKYSQYKVFTRVFIINLNGNNEESSKYSHDFSDREVEKFKIELGFYRDKKNLINKINQHINSINNLFDLIQNKPENDIEKKFIKKIMELS